MIEIWPAGPPKLMNPSLSQKRKASRNAIGAGGAAGLSGLVFIELAGHFHPAQASRSTQRHAAAINTYL
jgi:hypothetical protein